MGIGMLRRHRGSGPGGGGSAAPELEEPVSANTVPELDAFLEHHGIEDADLAPGSGASGNVVKKDKVAAVEALLAGEAPAALEEEGEGGAEAGGEAEEPQSGAESAEEGEGEEGSEPEEEQEGGSEEEAEEEASEE